MSKVARTKIDIKEHCVSNSHVVTAIALPNRHSISQRIVFVLSLILNANTAPLPGNILSRLRRWIGPLPLTSWRPAMPALLPMPPHLTKSQRHRNAAQFVPSDERRDVHWASSLGSSTCHSNRGNAATASSLIATRYRYPLSLSLKRKVHAKQPVHIWHVPAQPVASSHAFSCRI